MVILDLLSNLMKSNFLRGKKFSHLEKNRRAPIISALLYHKDTHLVLTQEDGTISVYPMFSAASPNKKAQTIPSTGEVQEL